MTDKKTTLQEIINEVTEFRDKRNWKQFHSPKNLSMAISTEAGELMEHFLWDDAHESKEKVKDNEKMDEIEEELADVLIFSLSLADILGRDVSDLIRNKLEKNKEKYPEEKAKGNAKKYTELDG